MSDPLLIGVLSSNFSADSYQGNNIVGGAPLVPNGWRAPKCGICNEEMSFLLRIDAPVGTSIVNRLLYMFVCSRKSCLEASPCQCFTVLRFQSMQETNSHGTNDEKTPMNLSEWEFEGADDWGGDFDLEEEDTTETTTNNTSLTVNETSVSEVHFHPLCSDSVVFDGRFIEVFEDSKTVAKENKTLTTHERFLLEKYYGGDVDKHIEELYNEAVIGGQSTDNEEPDEELEEMNSVLMTKFVQRLSSYPTQIIRYQWAGKPLLAETLPDEGEHTRCRHCGISTVFELQITPGLFGQIKCVNESVNEALRFVNIATILLFSCSDCCWERDRTEGKVERCVVQLETASTSSAMSDED